MTKNSLYFSLKKAIHTFRLKSIFCRILVVLAVLILGICSLFYLVISSHYRESSQEHEINGSLAALNLIGNQMEDQILKSETQLEELLDLNVLETLASQEDIFSNPAALDIVQKLKKLEDEKQNILRINDILAELEKQLDPLEKQSETAKEYLKKKEELKTYDVNQFLLETERLQEQLSVLTEKAETAQNQLEETSSQYENIKKEHARIEEELEELNSSLDSTREAASQTELNRQQLEGQIEILKEQIHSVRSGGEQMQSRMAAVDADILEKRETRKRFTEEQKQLDAQLKEVSENSVQASDQLRKVRAEIEELNRAAEQSKNTIIGLLNERASTKGQLQRYDAMQEQAQIRRTELNQKLLTAKGGEEEQRKLYEESEAELQTICSEILSLTEAQKEKEAEAEGFRRELGKKNEELEIGQTAYHRESSKLESLRNMAERYDGYGNSIRKVMERKKRTPGILGVVADLIKVDEKYETAIETALGGNIQNIVTDTEETAKELIEYLKENRLGRATFLPLTSVGNKDNFPKKEALSEKGAIGLASTLVQAERKYDGIVSYLLGRVLVAEQVDDAIRIARKYGHSLHIVTLEGEYLSPGGSMTGGAFRNSSNLLGRRRELEELEENVRRLKTEMEEARAAIEELKERRRKSRQEAENLNGRLQEAYLRQNTAKLNTDQAKTRLQEITADYQELQKELAELESQLSEIRESRAAIAGELSRSEELEQSHTEEIEKARVQLEALKGQEAVSMGETERIHLEMANLSQKAEFAGENVARIDRELDRLRTEEEDLKSGVSRGHEDIRAKEEGILALTGQIEQLTARGKELEETGRTLAGKRESLLSGQKEFFTKREALSEQKNLLDREVYRLNSQREKLEEASDAQTNYMWDEYELTYNMALPLRNRELTELSVIKKRIAALKDEIRKLGDVNVNAIEDYKNVSERYTFMNSQRNDLVNAEETLKGIIKELDEGMRRQFEEQFARIRVEFDKAFKELFGGGKGTLELEEDADMLEAGVRIIAQPPGKKLQNMMQLSGGEKALTAISLLFAIQNLKPSPFCLLDEIEAALDDSNVGRFAKYLHKLTKNTQFIIITHRKGTMESADRLYGITMQEKGVSALVSVNLIEEELDQ